MDLRKRPSIAEIIDWLSKNTPSGTIAGGAPFRGGNQSPTITQRYLNTASYLGDPGPGNVVNTASVSGSIVQSYRGMVGGILTLSANEAFNLSDPINGPYLYGGDYQYVQFYPNSTSATAVQGQIMFWVISPTNDLQGNNFWVTPDGTTGQAQGPVAGIALGNTAKGNYWFIQVAGIAEVKFKTGALNNFSPSVADLVYVDQTPGIFADCIASQDTITAGILKEVLGRAWYRPPVAGAISPVFLGIGPQYYPGGGI